MELASLLLYLLLSLSLSYAFRRTPSSSSLPPGPLPLPVVGNLLSLRSSQPHRSFALLASLHGPILTLRLGLTPSVVLSSPSAALLALQTLDPLLSSRWVPDVAKVHGHDLVSLLWLPPNQSWKQLRAICATNLFSSRSLELTRSLRQLKVRQLLAFLASRSGREVRVVDPVFGTVLNLMSNTLFSVDMTDLSSGTTEFREFVTKMSEDAAKPNVSDFFPVLAWFDLQGRRKRSTWYAERLDRIFDEIIDRRLDCGGEGKGDVLDSLLKLMSEGSLSRLSMRILLEDLLMAGIDTTSVTLEWAMAELLANPKTLEKARTELREVIGPDTEVDESNISRLPYLQAVVKEVMRLHPPAPFMLPHMASEDVQLGGYTVPKNTQVLVNVWAIGRHPDAWTEPEVFRPERFLEKEVDFRGGRDFEYLPFGAGRRSCPGLPLATRMLPLTLASMLHAFEWRLPEGMEAKDVELKERFGVTLCMAAPLKAVPVLVS